MAETGVRRGELAKMKIGNVVNHNGGYSLFFPSLKKRKVRGKDSHREKKINREVPLKNDTHAELQRYLKQERERLEAELANAAKDYWNVCHKMWLKRQKKVRSLDKAASSRQRSSAGVEEEGTTSAELVSEGIYSGLDAGNVDYTWKFLHVDEEKERPEKFRPQFEQTAQCFP